VDEKPVDVTFTAQLEEEKGCEVATL